MDWVYIVIKLVMAFILLNLALVITAFLVYFERKVAAHMQARQGPNRAGPLGLLQSFADLLKALKKENTRPKGSDKWVFYIAPVVSTFSALGILAIIPFGPAANQRGYIDMFGRPTDWFVTNVSVGVLMLLALSSLGVYGLIMAGWGSNSKYSLLGGLRSSAQVISYEIILGISLVGIFLLSGTLDLTGIINAQHPNYHSPTTPGIWFILLQPIAFLVFFTSIIAETNRTPFDLPEAESELVGGYHTEYSGIRFLLFQLAEYIAMVTMSCLFVICFLGGWVSPFAGLIDNTDIPFLSGLLGSGIWWFIFKLSFVIFAFYWIRWTVPRFRFDQLMGLCWKVFLPLILANILVIATLRLIFFPPGSAPADFNPLYWWIIAIIEVILFVIALLAISRTAGASWFGKAERAILVDRQLILVRNVQGGRGTIEGEAKPIDA